MSSVQLSAFRTASGISISDLSLYLRILLSLGITLWGAWILYSKMGLIFNERCIDIFDLLRTVCSVSILMMLMFVLVN